MTRYMGIDIFQLMETTRLSDLSREERAQLIIKDSVKYVRLMSDADIDRLLASLSKRPIVPHTKDYDDLMEISAWYDERYPDRAKARSQYSKYLVSD